MLGVYEWMCHVYTFFTVSLDLRTVDISLKIWQEIMWDEMEQYWGGLKDAGGSGPALPCLCVLGPRNLPVLG